MATLDQIEQTNLNLALAAMEKPINQERVMVPAILFKVDPYAASLWAIKQALRLGFRNDGSMSHHEYHLLKRIEAVVMEIDDPSTPLGDVSSEDSPRAAYTGGGEE